MEKQKKSMVVMARILVLALLVGVFAAIPSMETFAAANKALRMKVAFDGDRESDDVWSNDNYILTAAYKKNAKVKKNMKMSAKVYVPASVLKEDGDTIHVDTWTVLNDGTSDEYVGDIRSKYTVMLIKDGQKMRVALWDTVKQKELKPGKMASFKKSGKYYVVTIKNMPLENIIYNDDQAFNIDTKTTYSLAQSVSVTGTCTKGSGYAYIDDLKLSGTSTQTITFNKKDYKWYDGWHLDKECAVKITAVK